MYTYIRIIRRYASYASQTITQITTNKNFPAGKSAMYIPVHMVYYSYAYVCHIKNRFESGTMPIHMHSHAGC